MKPMDFAISTSCIFLGLLSATSDLYAQEAIQKTSQRSESVTGNLPDSFSMLLHDAEELIKNGKPDEAYRLLQPLEFEHAGELRFDYLIGIAALDSGRPDMATLSFERVLAVNPGHVAARLDMARAYYQLGDFSRAETEFTISMKQNSSAAVRANIQKYLDTIATQKDGARTKLSGYFEMGMGQDSNVNYSTEQSQISYYNGSSWINISLDPVNVKTSDSYYAAATGGEVTHGLNSRWSLYAGANFRKHGNSKQTRFDSFNADWHAGLEYETQGSSKLRVSVVGSRYDLGRIHNSDTSGFKGEWRYVFSPANQLNALAQSVQYRYADPLMKPNDIDQQAYGLGWLHVLSAGKSMLSANVNYGTEKDVSPEIKTDITTNTSTFPNITINPGGGRIDGAKRFSGLRIGCQMATGEKTILFASAGTQTDDYEKENSFFQRTRKDRLYDLNLGADWHWNKLWTLRPQVAYSKNDSNLAIYNYDRIDVSLTVRRDFRQF